MIENLSIHDPFANNDNEGDEPKQDIHVRAQQRNGKKMWTTVQGLSDIFCLPRILKAMKKEFSCNGHIIQNEEFGEILQFQGDHRAEIRLFLLSEEICTKDELHIHGG